MSDKKLQIKDFEKNNYFATQELVDVVNAALFLDKPLLIEGCLLYTSPSPRDRTRSRMPSSA